MVEPSSDMTDSDDRVLQAIYDQLRERDVWPTFAQIDRVLDRSLGIEDAQAALAGLPAEYLPRAWNRASYSDTDEVRLTLRGVAACSGSEADLRLLVRFLRWAADQERHHDGDDAVVVASTEFARVAGLQVGDTAGDTDRSDSVRPAAAASPDLVEARRTLARVGVLAHQMPTFWTTAQHSSQERWRWAFTLERGIRRFRDLADEAQLLGFDDEFRRATEHTREENWAGGRTATQPVDGEEATAAVVTTTPSGPESLDVLMTLLRPEIAETAGKQLRRGLYDDAIFAAYRRVEHEIQRRTGLTSSIGDTLVREAFREANDRITISDRPRDAERMAEIFGGVLGLFKGDRSHKDKAALPCRSRRECLRLLVQASSLLDLLDRGIERAPHVDGFHQLDDVLELSVQRVGPGAQVWLGDNQCLVRGQTSATLTVDLTDVPAGPHDLYIVDGNRQGPAVPIFVTREPGRNNWYRVTEVGIELFRDESGTRHPDVFGVRLEVLESGVHSERIVATNERYEVGQYVRWEWTTRTVGPIWARQRGSSDLLQLYVGTTLFNGSVIGSGQPPRTIRFSLEPPVIRLRRGDKVPLRALRHLGDGIATWSETLDNPAVVSDDNAVAFFKGGVVHAKQDGEVALRLHHEGQFCAAAVDVAAHPSGSSADLLTGLPTVAGIACVGDQVMISTRGSTVWSVKEGKYTPVAAVPLLPPTFGGTDTIAAAASGDLAVRLTDRRGILVLPASHNYRRSRIVELPDGRLITAMTWEDAALIVGTDTGEIWHVSLDGQPQPLTAVDGFVVSLAAGTDAVYVLAGSGPRRLLRFAIAAPDKVEDLLKSLTVGDANWVTCVGNEVYLTEFHKGQLLTIDGLGLRVVAEGFINPCAVAAGADGTLYVAEFGRGAVRRVFP